MHEKSPKSYEIESDDEYLSQDEKEIQKIKKKNRYSYSQQSSLS